MTFEVRAATPADGRAIAEVHQETFAATYTRWIPDVVASYDVERSAEKWARGATADGHHLMVAEEGGALLGFAASGPARGDEAGGAGEVYEIYVRPDRHGTGVGRALMADALGWMADVGYRECVLWVAERGTRSRRFYELVGFQVDDGVTRPWRGLPTVRYRRSLS